MNKLHQLLQLRFKNKLDKVADIILFDSISAAQDIAFMLGGEWDGCNGVIIAAYDEVAINTAAKLSGVSWCKSGEKTTLLIQLLVDDLLRRYALGDKNFSNANLRGVTLLDCTLPEINFCFAQLNGANLKGSNLSKADLTAANLSEANLTHVNLSNSSLMRANLTKADLTIANLKGANLSRANLSEVCFYQADLRGANLSLADLRGADLTEAKLLGANLTEAKLNIGALDRAVLS